MAYIQMYDPLTSEARSPLIAGLTEACYKLSEVLDLQVAEAHDMPLNPIYITENDQYRLYQAPLGNKLWLESPPPVIRQNGIVITEYDDEFTIDYLGGSINFDNGKHLTEFDTITADYSYIIGGSDVIDNLLEAIDKMAANANRFRGYYNDASSMEYLVDEPTGGDFAIVGGEENNIYIWNSTEKKWEPVHKEIVAHGDEEEDDNYYYGGRKEWVNVNDKVRDTTLDEIDFSNMEKITEKDHVLSAFGKLQAQIDGYSLFAYGDPTTSTEGKIGQDYTNVSTGEKFHLTEISENGEYIWTAYQNKSIIKKVTLDADHWVGDETPYTQTVSVDGVIADQNKQIVTVSVEPIEEYIITAGECFIYCTNQGDGELTFTAFEDLPGENISFNIILQNL